MSQVPLIPGSVGFPTNFTSIQECQYLSFDSLTDGYLTISDGSITNLNDPSNPTDLSTTSKVNTAETSS